MTILHLNRITIYLCICNKYSTVKVRNKILNNISLLCYLNFKSGCFLLQNTVLQKLYKISTRIIFFKNELLIV